MNEDTHKGFLERLKKSHIAVYQVAHWFRKKGYQVVLPSISEAPTRAEWKKHSDDGDMFVRKDGETQLIEVKRIKLPFTKRGNWPFDESFIVDSVSTYDGKSRKPDAYAVLGSNMACMAILSVKDGDQKDWVVCHKKNKDTNEYQKFYYVHRDEVKFTKLEAL